MSWKQVTQEEFYAAVGPLNCTPQVRPVPYTDPDYGSDYVMLDGSRKTVGRTVNVGEHPHWKPHKHYFLPGEA